MSDDKENRIRNNYSELKKFIENQNYAKVIKSANKIISESELEAKAWHCKLAAHIHLGDFTEALQSLKRCKVIDQVIFEKAYCEYRLNRTLEAWKTISATKADSSVRIKELKAQILYRLERYDECFTIYRDLVKTTSDQFDQERLTNLAAVCVNRIYEGSKERGPKPRSDATYEQIYNFACELLSFGQIQESLKKLHESEALCRTVLTQEEGASEEEVNEEIAVIRVQQGHCLQLLGREKEALAIYNAVLKTKPDDPALLAIVNNNIVAINREANVFDSKKRLKTTIAPGLEHKLTSRQRGVISLNHCLLAYHTSQDESIENEINQIIKNFPRQILPATITKSAILARAGKVELAENVLKQFAKENPADANISLLSAAQILLSNEIIDPVIDILLSTEEKLRYRSGIVSALVVLCSAKQNLSVASKVLKEALEWHKENKSPSSRISDLCRQSANFHISCGEPEAAVASLLELRHLDPSNKNTLAQLISAYSQFDKETAQSLSKELPDPSSIVSDIDAEALDTSFGMKHGKKSGKELNEVLTGMPKGLKSLTPSDEVKEKRKQKKKKKKKINLPKNYVIGEEPDPERWLPRWQRKGYKKKRDKRTKETTMKGTQGTSSDAADKFDITKTAGQHKATYSNMPTQQSDSGYKKPFQKKKGVKKKKKGQW
ncbi:UNVERIFIED_CONTAM: hypothetical protein RMT77_011071 [Armadillidium vulgare]